MKIFSWNNKEILFRSFIYLAVIQGPEIQDEDPLIEDDDAQLELQLALERYSQFVQVLLYITTYHCTPKFLSLDMDSSDPNLI